MSRLSAAFNAASTSPLERSTFPGLRAAASSCARYGTDEYDAFGPSFQLILSASRPRIAAQVLLAMTATPPNGWNATGAGELLISTTFTTPGTFSASPASNDATVPPSTCGRATTANSMSGRTVSSPYLARPVVMSKLSTILIRPLPMYRNWDGSLSFTWSGFGSGSFAASRATSPNESFRPVGR